MHKRLILSKMLCKKMICWMSTLFIHLLSLPDCLKTSLTFLALIQNQVLVEHWSLESVSSYVEGVTLLCTLYKSKDDFRFLRLNLCLSINCGWSNQLKNHRHKSRLLTFLTKGRQWFAKLLYYESQVCFVFILRTNISNYRSLIIVIIWCWGSNEYWVLLFYFLYHW